MLVIVKEEIILLKFATCDIYKLHTTLARLMRWFDSRYIA